MTSVPTKPGTLYGIGVGPGAPDLITLRAVAVLRRVDVVLAAASSRNDYSTALDIARPHLPPGVVVERLAFPMTTDREALSRSWRENAEQTAAILQGGADAAFLTLGDPLIYSTFGYLMREIARIAPHITVETVPGVTSFQAAATRTNTVLCEGDENFIVLPGIRGRDELARDLEQADNAAVLKAYRTLPDIRTALAGCHDKDGLFVSRVGLDGETVCPVHDAPPAPNYLSLVLVTPKNRE